MRENAIYDEPGFARKFADHWFENHDMYKYIDELVRDLPAGGTVLDAGCGPGRDILALAERGVEAIGIDTSPAMLAEARRLTDGRIPPSQFRHMDVGRLDFPAAIFVGVWSSGVFHHLREDAARVALSEFHRVLVLDGLLFLAVEAGTGENVDDVGRYRKFYQPDELQTVLAHARFREVGHAVSSSDGTTTGRTKAKRWLTMFARKSADQRSGAGGE